MSKNEQLLRKHMPVLHFVKGERFFPIEVEPYVERSRLVTPPEHPDGGPAIRDSITIDDLDSSLPKGSYLQFVTQEEQRRSLVQPVKKIRRMSSSTHRLAYVGLFGRVVDAGFKAVNIARSLVPPGVSDAAANKAKPLQKNLATCYGRVVEDSSWISLHYFYFYAMNDWRSRFSGVNDHEADWEQVIVYLDKESHEPRWVAYASHDHEGDDLRRRWDDAEVQKHDDRPVIYVGAGSHASYFAKGEYLTSIHISFIKPFVAVQKLFRRLARLPTDRTGLDIPFIDIALGDGKKIGHEHSDFNLVEITHKTTWAMDYKGLWGLDTFDSTGGERAPAGPKYNRDGTIRASWADPVGWAGLHKVVSSSQKDNPETVRKFTEVLDEEIEEQTSIVQVLGLSKNPEVHKQLKDSEKNIIRLKLMREAVRDGIHNGSEVAARSHLNNPAQPLHPNSDTRRALLNLWALFSAPLIFMIVGLTLVLPSDQRIRFFAVWMVGILIVELFTKKNLLRYGVVYALLIGLIILVSIITSFVTSQILNGLAIVFVFLALLVLYWNLRDRFLLR